MNTPRVSVVIPTFNRSHTIERAVRSVLSAVEAGDEVIVVDDGSTDGTEHVLGRYRDQIRYVSTPNGGAGKARNRGVREAQHPLVAFLDSDDEWCRDRLLLGRRLLAARPDALFCFTDFGLRTPGAPERHGGLARWHRDPRPWDEILGPGSWYSQAAELPPGRADFSVHVGHLYSALLDADYVPVQTLLVRRTEAGSALRFGEGLPTYEDWECVARLARRGKAAYLDVETSWQWHHDTPRLTDADEFTQASTRLDIISRVWGSDPEFLASDGDRVRRLVRDQQLIRLKWLLRHERMGEARTLLQGIEDVPTLHRLVALMPPLVVRASFAVRSALRRRAARRSP